LLHRSFEFLQLLTITPRNGRKNRKGKESQVFAKNREENWRGPVVLSSAMKETQKIPMYGRPRLLVAGGLHSSIAANERLSITICTPEALRARSETMTTVLRKCMEQPLRPH
jgi:hypothetical protein